MAYIGKTPTVGNFVKLDALTASATASYTMQVDSVNFSPESVNHMLVSLNGVIQSPTTSYTISGSTITFASALTSSDSIDFIMVYGNVLDIGTPSDATVTNAKTNFVSTSSAAGLQIKGDGTTDGTLQLNCSQNSHGIKLKSPQHSTSSSYTLTFPGTDPAANKMLQTDGSGNLSFVDAPSGALNFVTSATSSSNHNEVAIDNCFTSTYENYLIIGNMTVSNTGDVVRLRMRGASGTISTSGSYVYSFQKTNAGSSTFDVITSTADSNFTMTAEGDNDEQRVTFTFKMYLFDPLSAAKRMGLRLSGVGIKDNGTAVNVEGAGQFTSSTALTGVLFYPSSNQFKNSTIRVYGISDS